jgi:hypothetical protein
VYGQEAGNAQAIGQGSINDTNTLAQAIASTQMTGAAGAANLPLQYGSLSLASQLLPSQIAANQGQGSYYGGLNAEQLAQAQLGAAKPFGVGNLVFSPSTGKYTNPTGGGGMDGIKMALEKTQKKASSRQPIKQIGQYVQPA